MLTKVDILKAEYDANYCKRPTHSTDLDSGTIVKNVR